MKMNIGRIIKTYRFNNDLSQTDLCEELGVTKQLVSLVETGTRPISKNLYESLKPIICKQGVVDEKQFDKACFVSNPRLFINDLTLTQLNVFYSIIQNDLSDDELIAIVDYVNDCVLQRGEK